MSHHAEEYDANIGNGDGSTEVDRLENELEAANKKAKTFFESMKRSANDANIYRSQYEKLYEGVQTLINKANTDRAKIKAIHLEALLQDNE